MALAEHQNMIQTLSPYGSHEKFGDGVRFQRAYRSPKGRSLPLSGHSIHSYGLERQLGKIGGSVCQATGWDAAL